MADEVHVGDIGTVYELEIQESGSSIDISSYTTLQIIFLSPADDAVSVAKTALFTTDGTDALMRYVSLLATEFDVAGNWQMQGRLAKTGQDFKTEVVLFDVVNNL